MHSQQRRRHIVQIVHPRAQGRTGAQRRLMCVHQCTRTPILRLQRAHHRHKVGVTNAFQFPDRISARLFVGLARDQVHQLVGEFGHIHQLGPRPFQRGAELRHEMLHPRLAARDAVGFEQAHLRPADAKAIADRIVDFFGGGHAVLDQPQRLAPDRFKETVRDMCVNLLADAQRIKAHAFQNGCATMICSGRVAPSCSSDGLKPEVDEPMTASGKHDF